MTDEMPKVKPCPWCASVAVSPMGTRDGVPEEGFVTGEQATAVLCLSCGSRGPCAKFNDRNGAVRVWNQIRRRGEP